MAHRLLLVDDQIEMLDLLGDALRGAGFEVTATTDGRFAREELRTHAYDLLISDVVMPDVSGYELLNEAAQDIPVVLMSGNPAATGGAQLFEESTRGLGGTAALRKPFSPSELVEKVRQILADPSARLPRRRAVDDEHLTF